MPELNIVGDFRFDTPVSSSGEIALMERKVWEPSAKDFKTVAGSSAYVCNSFLQMLGVILMQPKKSVGRINVFTHGNPDLIAFKGRIVPGQLSSEVLFESEHVMSWLDKRALDYLNGGGQFGITGKPLQSLADVHARWGTVPILCLYSCKSGMAGSFLQSVANTLKLIVNGFSRKIAYCPRFTKSPLSIDRRWMALNDCADTSKTSSFYTLMPDGNGKGWLISKHPR